MNDFFLSVSQEIPSCPDFVFCIRVFCTAYKGNRYEFILPAKTVLSHFSMLVLERIVFSFRNHKSNQSLISYHTFVSTLQFQANKIISKFCTARRVKEQSKQATARQNLMLIVGSTEKRTRLNNSKFVVCQISSGSLFQLSVYRTKFLSVSKMFCYFPCGMHDIGKHFPLFGGNFLRWMTWKPDHSVVMIFAIRNACVIL